VPLKGKRTCGDGCGPLILRNWLARRTAGPVCWSAAFPSRKFFPPGANKPRSTFAAGQAPLGRERWEIPRQNARAPFELV
jgi:hypothetical protein